MSQLSLARMGRLRGLCAYPRIARRNIQALLSQIRRGWLWKERSDVTMRKIFLWKTFLQAFSLARRPLSFNPAREAIERGVRGENPRRTRRRPRRTPRNKARLAAGFVPAKFLPPSYFGVQVGSVK